MIFRTLVLIPLIVWLLSARVYAVAAETKITSRSSSPKKSVTPRNQSSYRSISPKKVKSKTTIKKAPGKKASAKSKSRSSTTRKASGSKIRSSQKITTVTLPSPQQKVADSVVEVPSLGDARMERVYIQRLGDKGIVIPRAPDFSSAFQGKVVGLGERGELVRYSVDPDLQEYAKAIVERVQAPHVAVVAMEPSTGRILAIADKSNSIDSVAYHAGFPAASLFKVVTSAAAIEYAGLSPYQNISFRGGTYELSQLNYDPRPTLDRRIMTVSEALGLSCNPVFSRVALQFLTPGLLRQKSEAFGFNQDFELQVPLPISQAVIPSDDFEYGRTAAGFGDVFISPVHAALLMSAVANGGKLLEPTLVDQVYTKHGDVLYEFERKSVRQVLTERNARTLLEMMTYTTTVGTSRREFTGKGKVPFIVPAKTGTLRGKNPKGLNNWFIAAAPLENPRIAVAVIVVNPSQVSSKASHIGRLMLERYL